MHPVNVLARLNPKIGSYSPWCPTSTGDQLTAMDVAAALAGLPDNAYYLGRYIYAGDEQCLSKIMQCALLDLGIVAEIQGWNFKRPDTLVRMIKLGLYETAQERLCPECKGKEWFSHNCPACEGSGRQALSSYARAKYAGINRSLWNKYWGGRYEKHVFWYFLKLQGMVYAQLRNQLQK